MKNPALVPTKGQITRIYMENFMTYNKIEVRPGSYLNFVIGPNGTGKSTLVCAVLLGLGGKLKTLGRADQLKSYIKTGCEQAFIEIDINQESDNSLRIRREIDMHNRSHFYINGEAVTPAKVNDVRNKFNIQVDNLCTFLPQEKMHDFAKMNSQQLLEHTQRTVDNGDLLGQHENLKNIQSSIGESVKKRQKIEEQLESEKVRNERLRAKVKGIREKQALQEKGTAIQQKKAWLLYHDCVKKKEDVEKDFNLAKKSVDSKKKVYNQAREQLISYEESIREQQEVINKARKDEAAKIAVVRDRLERYQAKIDRLCDLKHFLKRKMEEEKLKRSEILEKEKSVNKLQNDLRNINATIEDGSIDDIKSQLKSELVEYQMKERKVRGQRATIEEEATETQYELRNVQRELQALEAKRNSRLDALRRHDPPLCQAIEWVNENKHLFRGEVFLPIMLEINVPDVNMAKYIETIIGYQDLKSFLCTYPDDMDLLIKKLRNEQKLRVNVATIPHDFTIKPPNIALSRIRPLGFYAYLKDFIVGPEPIIKHLCKLYSINNIPVGNDTVNSNIDKIPNSIRTFLTSSRVYSVSFSSYSGAKSTISRDLAKPRFLSSEVDAQSIQKLHDKNTNLEAKLSVKRNEIDRIDREIAQFREKVEAVNRTLRDIATKSQEKEHVKARLAHAQQQLEALRKNSLDVQQIKAQMKSQRKECLNETNRALVQIKSAQENLDKTCFVRMQAVVAFQRFGVKSESLKTVENEAKEQLMRAEDQLSAMRERLHNAETRFREAKRKASELTGGYGPGDRQFRPYEMKFRGLSDSIEDLDNQLEEMRALADFLEGGSLQVLEEYENRELKIVELEGKLENYKVETNELQNSLEQSKDTWLVPINGLVAKINENFGNFFASMGCAGEVSLLVPDKPDDYENYGIKIRVKYRDGVPLQDLSRNFQSGGERAVATAIYMLSLQNLTNVPFRFVDEINQGMDPVNERRITELIVRVTTKQGSSQYFFITPKLLPNLKCPDTMSVLCVYNGPNALPANSWNLRKFLANDDPMDTND